MKKIVVALFLVLTIAFVNTSFYTVVATDKIANENLFVRMQANTLISSIDEASLLEAALSNQVDYTVPAEIRNNIIAEASFQPIDGVAQDAIKLEVGSTVRKVGEITKSDGNSANLYVAVAAASEVKIDESYENNNGIKAWAFIYWIDIFGSNNELFAAGALWQPGEKVVNNRKLSYGTSSVLGLLWYDGPTVKYPTDNQPHYEDPDTYVGYTLRCLAEIDVVNVGTVTCNAISKIGT